MTDAGRARELHRRGQLGLAEALYRKALDHAPSDIELAHDFAILLMHARREAEAADRLQAIVESHPGRGESALALALCLRASGQVTRGLVAATHALSLNPRDPLAWLLKGSLQVAAGAYAEAEQSMRRCLSLGPGLGEAWHFFGEALQGQGRWEEASHAYQQALKTRPEEIFNIAICAEQTGQVDVARDGYWRMSQAHPHRADCLMRLAQTEAMLCHFDAEADAVARLEALLAQGKSLAADDVAEVFPLAYLDLSDAAKRQALLRYSARARDRASALGSLPPPMPGHGDRLRIGYLSPDFGPHAVGTLLEGFFAAHDRARVEVFGYSLRQHAGPLAARIHGEFEQFRDCAGSASDAIARQIRTDQVDVLIDLAGFTQHARPEILALRPAAIQLGWLGFIHPHEAPWLDALVFDETTCPSTEHWPFTDKVERLDTLLLPGGPVDSGAADRRRFGLPADGVILASFNNSYKVDAALIAAWVEILRRAPRASLMVYLPVPARPGFLVRWQSLGGDSQRLLLVDKLPPQAHADRVASCDLVLDAFRYQGGATALSAIANAVPVLCREGRTPASRLGVSLNRFLGLDDLVCADTAAYIAMASALANDAGSLAALKSRVSSAAATRRLFDPRRCAAAMERLCFRLVARPAASRSRTTAP